jgi:hypothetical protein
VKIFWTSFKKCCTDIDDGVETDDKEPRAKGEIKWLGKAEIWAELGMRACFA